MFVLGKAEMFLFWAACLVVAVVALATHINDFEGSSLK